MQPSLFHVDWVAMASMGLASPYTTTKLAKQWAPMSQTHIPTLQRDRHVTGTVILIVIVACSTLVLEHVPHHKKHYFILTGPDLPRLKMMLAA